MPGAFSQPCGDSKGSIALDSARDSVGETVKIRMLCEKCESQDLTTAPLEKRKISPPFGIIFLSLDRQGEGGGIWLRSATSRKALGQERGDRSGYPETVGDTVSSRAPRAGLFIILLFVCVTQRDLKIGPKVCTRKRCDSIFLFQKTNPLMWWGWD